MADLSPRARAPRRARVVPEKYLRDECDLLVRTLLKKQLATAPEIDPYKPGAAENPNRDVYGWLAFYRRLQRLHARQDESVTGARQATPGRADADDELIDRAQHELPLRLDLQYPVDGVDHVLVRPLSGHAMKHLDARDGILACLARHLTSLQRSQDPRDHLVRTDLMAEVAYQEAVCQWIATSDAAPRLPFDPVSNPRPEVPNFYTGLNTIDEARILSGFHRLNGAALAALRRRISIDTDARSGAGRAASWRTFTATFEADTNHVVPAQRFWQDRALVSLLATRALAAEESERQHAEAKARAESEAKNKRKR